MERALATNCPAAVSTVIANPLILDSIYVESPSEKDVRLVCKNLTGVYHRHPPTLVPVDERSSLLSIRTPMSVTEPNSWVHIKSGRYRGDIGRVGHDLGGGESRVYLVPRLPLQPDKKMAKASTLGKRKRSARHPRRLFNPQEIVDAYGATAVQKRLDYYVFKNNVYQYGLLERDFQWYALEPATPSRRDLELFREAIEFGVGSIVNALDEQAANSLRPGDRVEITTGEQSRLTGFIEVINDGVAGVLPSGGNADREMVCVPVGDVRKVFLPGDYVKILEGSEAGKEGWVCSWDPNILVFLEYGSLKEVSTVLPFLIN